MVLAWTGAAIMAEPDPGGWLVVHDLTTEEQLEILIDHRDVDPPPPPAALALLLLAVPTAARYRPTG